MRVASPNNARLLNSITTTTTTAGRYCYGRKTTGCAIFFIYSVVIGIGSPLWLSYRYNQEWVSTFRDSSSQQEATAAAVYSNAKKNENDDSVLALKTLLDNPQVSRQESERTQNLRMTKYDSEKGNTTKDMGSFENNKNEAIPSAIENNNINRTITTSTEKEKAVTESSYLTQPNFTTTSNSTANITSSSSSSSSSTSTATTIPSMRPHRDRFAYAFVIEDCNPSNDTMVPPYYRRLLYNVLVHTFVLRQTSSTADVMVLIQMSSNNDTTTDTLPELDVRLLESENIKYRYLPQSTISTSTSTLHSNVLSKLGQMTQYQRIILLDANKLMLQHNLDYLFELSIQGILKQNFIMPNHHVFMITPQTNTDWTNDNHHHSQSVSILADDNGIQNWAPNSDDDDGDNNTKQLETTITLQDLASLIANSTDYTSNNVLQSWNPNCEMTDSSLCNILPFRHITMLNHNRTKMPWLQTQPPDMDELTMTMNKTFVHHFKINTTTNTKTTITNSTTLKITNFALSTKNLAYFWFSALRLMNENCNLQTMKWADWTTIDVPPFSTKKELGMSEYFIQRFLSDNATTTNTNTTVLSPMIRNNKSTTTATTTPKFAYAFVIGGVAPHKSSYRQYIYDILICTYILRKNGSKADVIIFFQMHYSSHDTALPPKDIALLNAMNIQFRYIPKSHDQGFYRIMLDKFRILELTEYDRIMFLDGDIMLLDNMDYIFEMSMKGVLQKNLVFMGREEPANGGTFMLAPKEGDYDRILELIREKEIRGFQLPYPHWDKVNGWGQSFGEHDYYELQGNKRIHQWNFHGAFADQGLLYHWVKYEEKSVSIVAKDVVQNWDTGEDGNVYLKETISIDIFKDFAKSHKCIRKTMKGKPCKNPHSDFVHFTGTGKPWLSGPPKTFPTASNTTSGSHFWFHHLDILNREYNMGLNFAAWPKNQRPLLGMYPKWKEVAATHYRSEGCFKTINVALHD